MNMNLRKAVLEDADPCGRICFEAFKMIADQHNFPPDFPAPDSAIGLMSALIPRRDVYSVVAEMDGKVAGSNFLWEGSSIAGIGPITIDPTVQNSKVGRALMENVLEWARKRRFAGVRLVQAAYHNRSLALYTKLGFDAREPLSIMQGPALQLEVPGYSVRAAVEADLEVCNRVCLGVHGHERELELLEAIQRGTATVVEHGGRVTGYATLIGFFGHAVGETNREMKALIGAAPSFLGPGFLLPTRNSELFRWCLGHGLHVVQPMTLMSLGLYNEPAGAFLPSILY